MNQPPSRRGTATSPGSRSPRASPVASLAASLSPTGKPVPLTVAVLGVAAAAGVLAASVASVLDGAAFNLHAGVWAFLVVWAATTGYLSFRESPSGVLADGTRFLAPLVALVPLANLGPVLVGTGDSAGASAAAGLAAAGSALLVQAAVALVVAGLLLALGRRFSRRAERTGRRHTRDGVNRHV